MPHFWSTWIERSLSGEVIARMRGKRCSRWPYSSTAEAGTVTVTPLRDLSRSERDAVAEEGLEVASFLDCDPRVEVAAH